jgi:hypothetical protein
VERINGWLIELSRALRASLAQKAKMDLDPNVIRAAQLGLYAKALANDTLSTAKRAFAVVAMSDLIEELSKIAIGGSQGDAMKQTKRRHR